MPISAFAVGDWVKWRDEATTVDVFGTLIAIDGRCARVMRDDDHAVSTVRVALLEHADHEKSGVSLIPWKRSG